MGEALQTLGANPPKDPKPLFETPEAMPRPPECLIHTEWDAVEMVQLGPYHGGMRHHCKKGNLEAYAHLGAVASCPCLVNSVFPEGVSLTERWPD
jgi:hypothetical protein